MTSFIASAAGRKAFVEMASKAVKKAIDLANAKNLPRAYDNSCPEISKQKDKFILKNLEVKNEKKLSAYKTSD